MESENSAFQKLSELQIKVLTFVAYAFKPVSIDDVKKVILRKFNASHTLTQKAVKDLEKKRFLNCKRHYFWGEEIFSLKSEWEYPVMRLLLTEYPNYVMKFKTAFRPRDPDYKIREAYYNIFKSIFDGNTSDLPFSEGFAITLSPHFVPVIKNHPEVMPFLPTELQKNIISKFAISYINNDDGEGVGKLIDQQLAGQCISHLPDQTLHLLQLGYVMQTGHRHEGISMNGHTFLTDLIEMLEAIEKQDYAAAVTSFEKAVNCKSEERTGPLKPEYFPLLNVLYAIAAYKYYKVKGGDFGVRVFASGLNKGTTNQTWAVRTFTDSMNCDNVTRPLDNISEMFKSAPTEGWINQKLAFMLSAWQGIALDQLDCDKSLCDPQTIEFNAHATRLTDKLLQTVRVEQQWERALHMIMKEEGQKGNRLSATDSPEKKTRLAYLLSSTGSYIEIREQTRLKSGRWSAGKRVSENNFVYMNYDYMDDVDMGIKEILKPQRYDVRIHLNDILPILKGSNKLYYGDRAPYANCTVVEDKPFITTRVTDDGISISSNLPQRCLTDCSRGDLMVCYKAVKGCDPKEPKGVVTYYKANERVRKYVKALTTVGKFPLSAEKQLKLVFDQIKGLVEIHSEMIEGGSTLPQVEGNSHVIIQIVPANGMYDVQAVVRPLENGNETVVPGRGDSNVYDQGPDNVRYHVIRDKKQERLNAKALRDFMETDDMEESSPYVWTLDPYSLLELMEWIPEQGSDYTTEWPEGKKIKLSTPNTSKWNISLKETGGWFDVEGQLPIDEETVLSIGQLLNFMGQGRGRFIKLEDGQYLRLTEGLRRQLKRIDSVANSVRGKMRISPLGAGLIADYLDGDIVIDHPKKIDDLRKRIKKSDDIQVEIPHELNATLRDYQTDGVSWLNRLTSWGAGACLADDMGLGKTVQSITFLLQKQAEGASMVVAPASVVPNWKKEFDRFAPTLNVYLLNELSSDDRKVAIKKAGAGDIILTTYGLLISEEETLVEKQWNVVCLDEAHNIKNASTKTSGVCMKLSADKRLILTGTPIQNHLGELWNLFCFINPGLLGSYEQFTQKYINPIEGAHDKERQQQLRRIIQPFMLRRTKKEVVKELPDKQEITVPVELSKEELAIYELIRMEAKAQLEVDAGGNGAASVNALAMITKLRMASCSATLVQNNWSGLSSKLSAFSDLVSEICTAGNRVLVFSQFTSFLELAARQLESLGIKDYLYLDGSTTIRKRTTMVEQFQAGKSQIFLISLKAGGLGLNLTGANYVIHLDPWWNPAIEQQATDRAYRIGQKQKVTVYHLISGHTIEEKIVRLHQTKRDLADSLLDGTDMSHKLSAKDLLDMLEADVKS